LAALLHKLALAITNLVAEALTLDLSEGYENVEMDVAAQ
jgi:hypothetical protein